MKIVEMYDPETDTWSRVADLPHRINGLDGFMLLYNHYSKTILKNILSRAKMELFDGLPTLVGGYIHDERKQNRDLFVYNPEQNKWHIHEIQMRIPRSSPAVFQVPRKLFNC